jgi:NitT/TauT family transport system permease protein
VGTIAGKAQRVREHWPGILAIILAILVWQSYAAFIIRNPFLLPGPVDVLLAFIDLLQKGVLITDFKVSLMHFAIGLGMALIIGIPIGIAMGWNSRMDAFLNPLIEILRPIPPLAWIPFAIIWFGFTPVSAGFVIFMGAVFPILINTYTGFRGVSRIFVEAGRMLGCTRTWAQIRFIAFPAALPSVISGIRIATGVGWMCLVAAELFGVSNNGLGKDLWFFYDIHQMDAVVVYMLLLGLIGLAIDMVFRYYFEGRLLKWRTGEVA